ncbi:hypothetical protein [Helicobacter sp. 23-1045]
MRKIFVSGIIGILAVCAPLSAHCDGKCAGHTHEHKNIADKSTGDSALDAIKSEITKVQKSSVAKIFSENIAISDTPQNHKNWGEWIIAENTMDRAKWRAVKIKGTSMWGISPIIDGKNDCGAVLWICQHSKKIFFNAEKFAKNGKCGDLRESYKDSEGNYKKVVVPLEF